MRPIFCPRCHRQVEPPDFIREGKVKVQGAIVIGCPCGGKVTIRGSA